jgi:hypothetical protein
LFIGHPDTNHMEFLMLGDIADITVNGSVPSDTTD